MDSPRYPNVKVKLTGTDGNAFAILGKVSKALRQEGVPEEDRNQFLKQASSGNYDQLLATCMEWVDVR